MGAAVDRLIAKLAGPADEPRDSHGRWAANEGDQSLEPLRPGTKAGRLPEGLTFGVMARGTGPVQRLSSKPKSISASVDGKYVGHIFWHEDTGEVEDLYVNPKYGRRGIATALWQRAKEQDPNVHHSRTQTQAGKAWSKAVGMSRNLNYG